MKKDKFWEYFDEESREYVQTIMDAEGDYYDKAEKFITPLFPPNGRVLDIGNGGILNYDYSNLKELVCADIWISKKIEEAYKDVANISFIESNIMDMNNIESGYFDIVIVQNVIHHLAENDYRTTRKNCVKAMKESTRVLKRGGKLIICESTVKRWFEILEKIFFKPMLYCCDLLKFDRVFQYSSVSLEKLLKKELVDIASLERMEDIVMGEHILFLGRKFPAWLLPCSVTFYLLKKEI